MSQDSPERAPPAAPDWELQPLPVNHGQERSEATARMAEPSRRPFGGAAGMASQSDIQLDADTADVGSLWRPGDAERAQWFVDRLQLLKVRTGLVVAVGVVGLGVGLLLLGAYGSSFLRWLTSLWFGGGADWIHVPASAFASTSQSRIPTLLQFVFFAIGALGIAGVSRDALNDWQRKLWVGLLAAIGAAMLFIQVTDGHALGERKRLQVALVAQNWDEAEPLIAMTSSQAQQYLRAQIAMRTQDKLRLAESAGPLLVELDSIVLRQPYAHDLEISARLRKVDDFRPSVIHQIDVALNGAPRSEIALDYAKRQAAGEAPDGSRAITGLRVGLGLAGGVGLIAAAAWTLVLWRRMARRIRWLAPWIEPSA
jgi:hypothetical protein